MTADARVGGRTVVIGLEDTAEGADALALGALLASTLGATPVIATSIPYPSYLMGDQDLQRALERATDSMFAAATDKLRALDPRTRVVSERSPARALFHAAEEEDALVVVVGSTDHGPTGRVLPGSTAANLLRDAPCAVAVAPRGYAARDSHRLQALGVAFNGSAESNAALATAAGLAARVRATVRVITAVAPVYTYGEALTTLTTGEIHSRAEGEARAVLDAGLAALPKQIAGEGRLVTGDPAGEIVDACADLDLLLLGSRGYGPLRRTILGSVSAAVVNSAECAVLVVPRGAGEDPLGLATELG